MYPLCFDKKTYVLIFLVIYVSGASLDGIYDGKIIEVKCPQKLALKNAEPDELDKLTPQQRASHFCEMDGDFAALKRGHKYYTQIQVILCQNDLSRSFFCAFYAALFLVC